MYQVNAAVNDPNLSANVAANGEFSGKYPGVNIKATIDSIKTFPLHLTPDSITYHGDITGNFTSSDPDHLNGNLLVTHSILVNGASKNNFRFPAINCQQ